MSGALVPTASSDAQVIELFLTTKGRRSVQTARVYGYEVGRFLSFAGKSLRAITYRDLLTFAEGPIKEQSPATQARALTTVRSLFRFAVKLGYLQLNPAELLEVPKVQNRAETRFLTKGELYRLLEVLKENPRNYLLGVLLATTGLRVAELASIRWGDFFEDAQGHIGLSIVGKGNKRRTVKVKPSVWLLARRVRLCAGRSAELDPGDSSPLLSGRGGPLSVRMVREIITRAAAKAGIRKKVSPHWLRHTAVTLAILGGASLEQVKNMAGHASITTTDRYLHAAAQLSSSATDFIDVEAD